MAGTGTASATVNGAPAGPPGGVPAGPTQRPRTLPDRAGGLMVIGVLSFAGPTKRNPKQCAVDLMCRDADGRQDLVKCSGWITQQDNSFTDLGQALTSGVLARLVGQEVAVSVRPRPHNGVVYFDVESIWSLQAG